MAQKIKKNPKQFKFHPHPIKTPRFELSHSHTNSFLLS
jgi:hypothetical protein